MNLVCVTLVSCLISCVYTSEDGGIDLSKREICIELVRLEDSIASSPKGIVFREAVQKGDMEWLR